MYDNDPMHPGELLREDIFPALGLSKAELARRLGLSVRRLNDLMAERQPVTLDMAMRLGAVVGYGPRYWLGLQAQHDIWRAEREQPIRLKPIEWRKAKTGTIASAAVKPHVTASADRAGV